MKQLGEQTAGAFADAQKVLGDETPETILKGKCTINREKEKENNYKPSSKKHHTSVSASVLMVRSSSIFYTTCHVSSISNRVVVLHMFLVVNILHFERQTMFR